MAPRSKPQPKAGSPAQREMVQHLASEIMATELAIWRVDVEMTRNGDVEKDLAYSNGQKVVNREEEPVTYKEWKAELREHIARFEASYPTLMPAIRKLIRKTRREMDDEKKE